MGLESPKLVNNSFNDRTVNLSDSTIFTCVFFGNPIPQVSWKTKAQKIRVESSIDRDRSEINSRLIVSNIVWEDRGQVSCHAISILGNSSGSGVLNILCKYQPFRNTFKISETDRLVLIVQQVAMSTVFLKIILELKKVYSFMLVPLSNI